MGKRKFVNNVHLIEPSERYKDYYSKCLDTEINCLEGAYRAGKSVINILSFANYLEYCPDRIHLATGATSGTARLNICDCNGLGLKYLFAGRCKQGMYENHECLKIKTKTGEKIVIFVGGSESNAYKRIQGLSFGSWLSVEVANLYISEDEKNFIDMAISRLTQSKDKRIWWDLNPVYPSHKIYTKYLDKWAKKAPSGGFNYLQCSLFDNTALTNSQRQSFLSLYPDENSMEYQRYIMGNRACAKGLIYANFAKDKERWLIKDVSSLVRGLSPQWLSIGVDFGGNGSNTAFVCTLLANQYAYVVPLYDDEIDMSGGESDVKEFRERFKTFLQMCIDSHIAPVRYIFGDSADTVMINEIKGIVKELHKADVIRVLGSSKETINQRIKTKQMLLSRDHWLVADNCQYVIGSTETVVWDGRTGHEDERLDNGTTDIDIADAEEYSWSAFMDKIIQRNQK